MTGHGDQREYAVRRRVAAVRFIAVFNDRERPGEPPRHVFHEARLAGARGPLEQNRNALPVGRFENFNFVGDGNVKRLVLDDVLFYSILAVFVVIRHRNLHSKHSKHWRKPYPMAATLSNQYLRFGAPFIEPLTLICCNALRTKKENRNRKNTRL